MKDIRDIPMIVETGGPCAGKTTGLLYTADKLQDYGRHVLSVPEIATEFFTHGVTIGESGLDSIAFQEQIFKEQLRRENRYREIAQLHQLSDVVILCDRGVFDCKAYMEEGAFEDMTRRFGYNPIEQLYERYAGIAHLVTAADGAEEFYTTENNHARTESPEQARILDERTLHAWLGHPHRKIIDNSTDFETKMRRLLISLCRFLGIPTPLEIERRFLVRPIHAIPVSYVTAYIEQAYLCSQGAKQRRIRRRIQNTHATYYQTYKQRVSKLTRIEREKTISARDYVDLLKHERNPEYDVIHKKRHCFTWKKQYFELDEFVEPARLSNANLWILEIELTEENDVVTIPDFISVIKEVTGDERFSNRTLAYNGTKLIS